MLIRRGWTDGLLDRLVGDGRRIVDKAMLFDWQRGESDIEPVQATAKVPPALAERLRPDDPELEDLRRRYASVDARVTTPLLWQPDTLSAEDLAHFRGENAYVWQRRGAGRSVNAYALTAYYLFSIGCEGTASAAAANELTRQLTDRLLALDEDGLFGAVTYEIGGRPVSRDLLDSIAELLFLDQYLGLGQGGISRILDIGAGYGRLAHRALNAFPEIERFLCADAVPESTYLSSLYLDFRGLGGRARVVPLDRIESMLTNSPVDVALNIHSFSECQPEAINWWLALLAREGVRYLMVAPNAMNNGGRELLINDGRPFGQLIERHGYRLIAREPKFADPVVQRYGLSPTMYHLFERLS